jgi:hypothetical protein
MCVVNIYIVVKNDLVTLEYAFQDESENLEDDAECDGECNESDLPVLPQELSPPKGKTRSSCLPPKVKHALTPKISETQNF